MPAGDRRPGTPTGDADPLEGFRRFRASGDRRLRNELIEANRWVALHCAQRFANRGEPLDDLIQVGMLGLVKAVERFDPEVGVTFSTYAVPTVVGELRRHFRDATWAVKVPRRIKDLHVEIGGAIEHLTGELSRAPTPQQVADYVGVSVDDVLEAMEAGASYRTRSVSTPTGDDNEERQLDALLGVDDASLAGADERVLVRSLLAELPARERKIVELRFWGGLSQSEIAEKIGVSQVHVSRLLRSTLTMLQRRLEGDEPR